MKLGKTYNVCLGFQQGEYGRAAEDSQRIHVKPKIKGKCVWIHPRKRFVVLEFTFRAGKVLESFWPEELG